MQPATDALATGTGGTVVPPRFRTRPGKIWPAPSGMAGPAGSRTLATEQCALPANVLVEMPKSTRQVDSLQSLDHRLRSQGHRLQRQEDRLQEAVPMDRPARSHDIADSCRQRRSRDDGNFGENPYQAYHYQAANASVEGPAGQAYGRSQAIGGKSGQANQSDRRGCRE
eukprot:3065007-Amphidinium_carterae.1